MKDDQEMGMRLSKFGEEVVTAFMKSKLSPHEASSVLGAIFASFTTMDNGSEPFLGFFSSFVHSLDSNSKIRTVNKKDNKNG